MIKSLSEKPMPEAESRKAKNEQVEMTDNIFDRHDSPFLKPEPELFVCDVEPRHKVILNKFCVLPLHLIVVPQSRLIYRWICRYSMKQC